MRSFLSCVLCAFLSGPVLAQEVAQSTSSDTTEEDLQLTMVVIRAYDSLLSGRVSEATALLKEAATRGHPVAPLVLCEMAWTDLQGAARQQEALHWAKIAAANGAPDVGPLVTALTAGAETDVDAFFAAVDEQPQEVAAVVKNDLLPETTAETASRMQTWMSSPKTTTLEVLTHEPGLVMIDGIIAGTAGEVFDIEPGKREIVLLISETQTKKVSIDAKVGQAVKVDLGLSRPAH